jgi:RNA-binding protein
MSLNPTQRKTLRRLGHDRKAIVMLGAGGLSAGVLGELDSALASHELVKVRVRAAERGERDELIGELCARTGAELVQRIGHVALLYRRHPERPLIDLGMKDAGADA